MVAAIAGIGLALSAIRAIIRLHGRVDGILATKAAADNLPFVLLPGPVIAPGTIFDADAFFFDPATHANRIKPLDKVPAQHRETFALVCKTEGLDALAVNRTGSPLVGLSQADKERFQVAKARIERLTSGQPVTDNAVLVQGDALAFYAVSSARLSNNPAYARLLIATADTLLEVVGENASLLISDPRTAGVIGTLVQEFSGGADFDDAGAGLIFRKLLFATAVTLETHRDLAGNDRVARAFIAALTDIRTNPPKDADGNPLDGTELVAAILTRGGVERLLSTFLTKLADDPHFSQTDDALRKTVGAVLREVSEVLPGGLTREEGLAIAEVAIAGIADDLQNRLEKRYTIDGKSLSIGGYVLTILVKEIRARATGGTLANDVLGGAFLGELYRAVLTGFLQRPDLIARHAGSDAAMQAYVGGLVEGILPLLRDATFRNAVGPALLPRVLGITLSVTADHAAILTGQNGYAGKIVEAALRTAAPLIQDGLSRAELISILEASVKAAADNLNLARMSDNLRPLAQAFATSLQSQPIRQLAARENRIAVARAFLVSLAENPLAWDRLGGKIGQGPATIVQPLLQGLVVGIAQEGGPDWSGPAMQDAIRRALGAALGQVDLLIDQKITEAVLQAFAKAAVTAARDIVNTAPGLGPEVVPRLLEGAISGFLAAVAANPALLGTKDAFAKAMIAASFATAAPLIQDGLTRQELSAIVKTAYDTARANTDLITMPELLRPVAEAFAAALSPSALATVGNTAGRQAIALVFLRSLEQNPATWAALEPHAGPALTAMLKPLYSGSVAAFSAHSDGLLPAGPLLALAVRQALTAGLPFANIWIDKKVSETVLQQTLRGGLTAFEQANNAALAPALAPRFTGLVLRQALTEAIALPDAAAVEAHLTPQRIAAIATDILAGLNP